MTYLELKALYRAELVKLATDPACLGRLSDDIWEAVYDREYAEPEFDDPVPDGIAELAALIAENPAISEQEVWDSQSDTITVLNAMSSGVHQQLHEDLAADWLTIKAEAKAQL